MRPWLGLCVAIAIVASCKKRDRGDDEAARAMALGALADIKQAIATAKTRLGTPDGPQGMARCASVASIRLDLRETPYHQLATELEQLCDVELPATELAAAVALLDDDPARCAAFPLEPQIALLEKSRPSPETQALVERYRKHCPTARD